MSIILNSFAHSSPYGGCWLEYFCRQSKRDLYGEKIVSEAVFRRLATVTNACPEFWIEGNFIVERHAIRSLCDQWCVNRIASEDGFLPHYSTLHTDPLGFCWESSLCRTTFRGCTDRQRQRARQARQAWLEFTPQDLPDCARSPYVLWPLQLIGDNVNRWDLALDSWLEPIRHFRQCLPAEYRLVLKSHPRSKSRDCIGIAELAAQLPNTFLIDAVVDLKTLLLRCSAVAGVNSSVLSEARLMFLKPAYSYGRSWFTGHSELIVPLSHRFPPRLPGRFDRVENVELTRDERLIDYADWFLYQLLTRQMTHETAGNDAKALHEFMSRLSFHSYLRYGEEIFA